MWQLEKFDEIYFDGIKIGKFFLKNKINYVIINFEFKIYFVIF